MIDKELLDILCCPETKVPVEVLSEDKLKTLNEKIAAGAVKTIDGRTVNEPL
ncbi:MAG: Trm112 family protein, partial [Gemmatimonadetes bacterium]|nr:Trm112 family protein [Gemmatimonadota bacterium]